jgi:hypothetical protein
LRLLETATEETKVKYSGLTVFILFFGIALIEAIRHQSWVAVALFVALGLMFVWSDSRNRIPH